MINALTRTIIGQVNLRNSLCNDPDRERHFQPRGLAVTQDNTQLYVTRFLSFTRAGGKQAADGGKEGVVCRLNINTAAASIAGYVPARAIRLARAADRLRRSTRTATACPTRPTAFPNQLQSIVLRGNRGYLPNIAASPQGPAAVPELDRGLRQPSSAASTAATRSTRGALNLHLGARNPEPGKKKLFFANPWAIAFTNQSGAGNAYVVSAGSDLLVKLNVDANGALELHGRRATRPATSISTIRTTRRPAATMPARTR